MQNLKSYFKTVLRRKIIGTIKNNFQIHRLDIHLKKLRVKIKLISTKKKIKKRKQEYWKNYKRMLCMYVKGGTLDHHVEGLLLDSSAINKHS